MAKEVTAFIMKSGRVLLRHVYELYKQFRQRIDIPICESVKKENDVVDKKTRGTCHYDLANKNHPNPLQTL